MAGTVVGGVAVVVLESVDVVLGSVVVDVTAVLLVDDGGCVKPVVSVVPVAPQAVNETMNTARAKLRFPTGL